MHLTLESRDIARVQRLTQTLLSPLEYPHVDDWRRAVCREARDLLGADLATFQLPNRESALFFSEELEPEVIGRYPDLSASLDRRFQMWKRKAALGVCSRAMLWGADLEEYERDAYYHEVVVPARGFDALIAATALDPQRFEAGTMATLMFHHDSLTGPRFGERGVGLLRLLQPAFEAGVRTYLRLGRWRNGFGRLLDTMPGALVLFEVDGQVAHENSAFTAMLSNLTEGERLSIRGHVEATARNLCTLLRKRSGTREEPSTTSAAREVRIAGSVYRGHAALADEAILGRAGGVLVTLERATPEPVMTEALREQFGLTSKEVEVALFLARGKSNAAIAKELTISPHTVRRHTERVLDKMNLHSRSAVGARLYSR